MRRIEAINVYDCIRYQIMRQYLEARYPELWTELKHYFAAFIQDEIYHAMDMDVSIRLRNKD
jgi:hypothetical protein